MVTDIVVFGAALIGGSVAILAVYMALCSAADRQRDSEE